MEDESFYKKEGLSKDQYIRRYLNRKLISAVKDGNLDDIGSLLDAGADVNNEESGKTPLGDSKDGDVTRFLISRGANVNLRPKYGDTPLLRMLKFGKLHDSSTMEIVKILLENGASVNEGFKAPLMAAVGRENNRDIIRVLLDHGADINDEYNTVLFKAVCESCTINVSFLLELYKEKNISIHRQNLEGMTPLMSAVVNNNLEIVEQLIEFGADVNIKDKDGNTPLLHVVTLNQGSCEILRTLKRSGSEVNCQNNCGTSLLMIAALNCWIDGLLILLDSGADVNAVSEKDSTKTALSFLTNKWAYHKDFKSCFEALVMKGASLSYINPGILHRVTFIGDLVFIRELIQLGLGPTDVEAESVDLHIVLPKDIPVISPFRVALLVGNASLARFYKRNMFLTNSDITSLTGNWSLAHAIEEKQYNDSQTFLDELSSQPWSLLQLAFVSVSSAVGSSPGRENRVDKLPLPQVMKDKLLFKSMCN